MMQGDQFRLPIELLYEDGGIIAPDEIKDLEVFVGRFRKTLSSGAVSFGEENGLYYAQITQEETFGLIGDVKLQARILFLSGDVVGVDLGTQNFEQSISKVVLR